MLALKVTDEYYGLSFLREQPLCCFRILVVI